MSSSHEWETVEEEGDRKRADRAEARVEDLQKALEARNEAVACADHLRAQAEARVAELEELEDLLWACDDCGMRNDMGRDMCRHCLQPAPDSSPSVSEGQVPMGKEERAQSAVESSSAPDLRPSEARADEAEHKLVAIRSILENYDPYETDYAFKVVRDIEELKP